MVVIKAIIGSNKILEPIHKSNKTELKKLIELVKFTACIFKIKKSDSNQLDIILNWKIRDNSTLK
jgi:hypothetical protein